MTENKRYAVLGLGSFGSKVAKELFKAGAEVLAVDRNSNVIHEISEEVTKAVVGDVRNREVLKELDVASYSAAVVSLGESIEASAMVVFHLRELKSRKIIAKAISSEHRGLLERIGATEVIFPEEETAIRLAKQIIASNLLEYFEIAPGYIIAEVVTPNSMVGKSLRQLKLRYRYSIQVLLIQQTIPEQIHIFPDPDAPLKDSDVLIIAGKADDVYKFAEEK
ncbi:TPA: potassium transporter TrkA [bacterium]|nr:MAG: hypothetical protein AUJ18_02040 [Candidatus Hydrogenedentes bacterium CG1_02_42_14]PIU48087.1 MAG: potassium transporter TrkA [Candidatus Hydrogenedentes bacterium CG07_land_8_20_14_0_80_42_17]HBW47637.1 potassium transporter TrkA [bacterium]